MLLASGEEDGLGAGEIAGIVIAVVLVVVVIIVLAVWFWKKVSILFKFLRMFDHLKGVVECK